MTYIDWDCADCGESTLDDYYMVKNPVWRAAGMPNAGMDASGMLHRKCLEKRIGRELTVNDFPPYPVNAPVFKEYGCAEDHIANLYESLMEIGFEAYEEQVELEYKVVLDTDV